MAAASSIQVQRHPSESPKEDSVSFCLSPSPVVIKREAVLEWQLAGRRMSLGRRRVHREVKHTRLITEPRLEPED